jgi:hypothetical protein
MPHSYCGGGKERSTAHLLAQVERHSAGDDWHHQLRVGQPGLHLVTPASASTVYEAK